MRMLSCSTDRTLVPTVGMLCVLFAVFLAGCASKNPLMDEPVAASSKEAKPEAARMVSAPVAEPAAAAPASDSGVQTTRNRRFFGIFSPYRPDIQQGNFVSKEMVSQLKEGMTPDQVRFVLGTPLLVDVFHADRWDYAFRFQKGNGEVTTSRVTVFFKDGRLARFEGGDLPPEKDYLARIEGAAPAPKPAAETPAAPLK